jgi:FkbM family methyltransferase
MNLKIIEKYFSPNSVLDIGAHHGEFYLECKNAFPECVVISIEGNIDCADILQSVNPNCIISLLGRETGKTVFYKQKNNLQCTGSSLYRELTHHFDDNSVIKEERILSTLDMLLPTTAFDLVKIDTQGSEVDIIKGGINLISKSKGVILEISQVPYNQGAPLKEEVI